MKPKDIKLGIELNGEEETFKRICDIINEQNERELKLMNKIGILNSEIISLRVKLMNHQPHVIVK